MKSKFIILIFSFLFINCATAYSQDDDNVAPKKDTLSPEAIMVNNGKFKCDSAALHLKKGETKIANKYFSDAMKDYKKALKTNKQFYPAYFEMGLLNAKTKDYKEAILNFTMAINIDSTHNDFYRERGIAEVELQKFPEAKKDFARSNSLDANDAATYYQIGLLAEHGRDKQPAFEAYEAALDIKPNFPDVLFHRGILLCEFKKDYVLAAADFAKVIELNPDYNIAYFWKGKAYFNGENYKGCDDELTHYLKIDSNNIDALIMRGAARLNRNDYSNSIRDFDDVMKLDPKNYIALTNRGLAKGGLKNFSGALEDLDLAIKLKFDYSPAYINRALVKYMNKDHKGACKDLHKADGLNNAKAYELLQRYCKNEQG